MILKSQRNIIELVTRPGQHLAASRSAPSSDGVWGILFDQELSTGHDTASTGPLSKVQIQISLIVKVSSSTFDKIYEITLLTKIGTKSALFTIIGTKFS